MATNSRKTSGDRKISNNSDQKVPKNSDQGGGNAKKDGKDELKEAQDQFEKLLHSQVDKVADSKGSGRDSSIHDSARDVDGGGGLGTAL